LLDGFLTAIGDLAFVALATGFAFFPEAAGIGIPGIPGM
jgi:hypothetical protein